MEFNSKNSTASVATYLTVTKIEKCWPTVYRGQVSLKVRYCDVSLISVLKVSDPDWDGTRRCGGQVVVVDVHLVTDEKLNIVKMRVTW